jgi:transcriptional regulator with XRE-family HTH domain
VHKDSSQRASVLQHVSQNVRRLRHAADMSQTALAEKSGVSRRMLVAIEAGEKNVSLTTLDRVAEALDVAFSDLIQAPTPAITAASTSGLGRGFPGARRCCWPRPTPPVKSNSGNGASQPGEVYPSQPDADGWSEQIYVFEGCLTLMVGEVTNTIATGEFFMFASNQPHGYRNDGPVAVRFVRNVVI